MSDFIPLPHINLQSAPQHAKVLCFVRDNLLISNTTKDFLHDATTLGELLNEFEVLHFGTLDNTDLCVLSMNEEIIFDDCHWVPTKYFLEYQTANAQHLLCRAKQLLDWHRTHQFCGQCATPLTFCKKDVAKHCASCEILIYPNFAPAVIISIKKDDQILLARSPHFPEGMYSVLAGFIEPGETAEQTLHREVFEEVGLKVKNVKYIGTQSWPFPHSFMIAFTADYDSGEIVMQEEEIEDARWFRTDNLPRLPTSASVSRQLIDDFLKNTE